MKDLRNRHKIKDITKRRRDTKGKVIKNHPDALDMLNRIEEKDENSSHVMSLLTNNLHLLTQKQKQIGDADIKKEAYIPSRVQKNGFHPYIWPAINQTAQKTNFSP